MKENSIEEEIKIALDKFLDNKDKDSAILIVEKFILGNYILIRGGRTNIVKDSLRYILSDYKKVLEINEVLLKENEKLKFEERKRIIGKYGEVEIHNVINKTLSNDYISVKKIKDKIEYLDKQQKQWLEDRELKASDSEIIFARDILQELLEGRK